MVEYIWSLQGGIRRIDLYLVEDGAGMELVETFLNSNNNNGLTAKNK